MVFSNLEIQRYQRHLLLKEIGGTGQQKLHDARVLVVGAGGLGSPVLMYLAAAGVGHIGIMDDDTVSLSNLQRQIIHDTARLGEEKADSAAKAIERINPHVVVEAMPVRISPQNALDMISCYDIVVDGSDNFATRYLINDACYFAKKPLAFGAVGPFDGQISTFRAYETDPGGTPRPSYRCIFPSPPMPGTATRCEETGVLGAVAGVVGTLLAVEVLKELLGIGESLVGKLLLYDALKPRVEVINVPWDPENPLNGHDPLIKDLSIHTFR